MYQCHLSSKTAKQLSCSVFSSVKICYFFLFHIIGKFVFGSLDCFLEYYACKQLIEKRKSSVAARRHIVITMFHTGSYSSLYKAKHCHEHLSNLILEVV